MYLGGDETLDSIVASEGIAGVDCAVHDTITSYAKDFGEFEGIVVDKGTDGRGSGGFRRRLLGRHPSVRVPCRWRGERKDRGGRAMGSQLRETMG